MITVGAKSDIGKKRDENQDSFYVSEDFSVPIYLVADGMGGHKAGELASTMVKDIVVDNFTKNKKDLPNEKAILELIKRSIEEANTKIYLKSKEYEDLKGMGTTIIMAYIYENKICLGHVGDSRAYIIKDRKISQITEDHSYVNQLMKSGSISREEAQNHPKRNMITRAVGSSSIIEVDLLIRKHNKNDILLLCSDGLTNMVNDLEILEIFKDTNNIQNSCEELIKVANEKGGIDNITILAIKFD